jgi:uncharacterized membrane protein YoaK (UPF0700 family)
MLADDHAGGFLTGAGVSGRRGSGRHHVLVGLLAFATGSVDAFSLIALGGAFTSVITGNLIFIGRAISTSSLTPAEHALLAVGGYVLGVALGSRLGHVLDRGAGATDWPRRASTVLGVEFAILVGLNVTWISYQAHPPARATDAMLVAAAIALGAQGAAARLISPAPSTTYMTGALTVLIETVTTGRHRHVDISAVAGLLAMVAGAAVGALLVVHAPRAALLPPLIAIGCVVTVKYRHHRVERVGVA